METKTRELLVPLLCAGLLAGGCGGGSDVEAELMQADRDFAAAVAAAAPAERAAVWAEHFTEDGRQIVRAAVVDGQAAIADLMRGSFENPGYTLTWEPDLAEAGGGDLGYTSGRYVSRRVAADGNESTQQGRYLTLWRRQADGSWKVALDTGVPDE